MRRLVFRSLPAILLLVTLLLAPAAPILAHGETTVGDYSLEIGFHTEPVILGEPNALDLFVRNEKTDEMVNGLADSLHAEIIFGASKKELRIEPTEEDGAYTAALIPTETGDYTWHIWGDIQGTPLDVSMTSSPDTFGSVEDRSALEFPHAAPSAADAQGQARTALIVAILAALLGAAGLGLGWVAMQRSRAVGMAASSRAGEWHPEAG